MALCLLKSLEIIFTKLALSKNDTTSEGSSSDFESLYAYIGMLKVFIIGLVLVE
jgi:hypothetical protein